ncbi:hypothetical protein FEDK69T_13590 [Flavobacterium enshiense DK69]|uniref:DUF445 domain-containing protein n=2 Tax=Flavobacterium TaxID=237 RepID=V6S998_9FLAO|nr:hypothetical protein FEDK69T_13590 [Flavobacterium enshiense DK69]KGO96558.1 hypothetical protein Q767_06610 [Flavobacterium enshiense DK69]
MKNRVGSISLLIAFGGFAVLETMMQLGLIDHWGWSVFKAGFEAGTVGGMADWFAVSALFHEIPIPYVRKHTDIIAKNREKLTEGIVDLVTNKWLSPEVIAEKLHDIDLAQKVIVFLKKPSNQEKAIDLIKKIALKLSDELDNPNLAKSLQSMLTEQLSELDLASSLGVWLEKSIKNDDHNQIWEQLLEAGAKSVSEPEIKELLIDKLRDAAKEYGNKSILKGLTVALGRTFNALDYEAIADELLVKANEFLTEARYNPNHPVRTKFDSWMLDFAHRLATGDEETRKLVDDFTNRFIGHADLSKIIQRMLGGFKNTLAEQLDNNETPLMQFVIGKLNQILDNLENDVQARERINHWIKDTISQMLEEFHGEIGNMVRSSLEKLDNKELVVQIEEKVGNDLQYIRLNGALVGGLVGVMIALVKVMFEI